MSIEALRLAGFVLPLCLDTFAISAAIGVTGLSGRQRLRLSLLFVAFEGGMPLIGLGLGAPLSVLAGQIADYVAAAVLLLLGGWMLWPSPRIRRRSGHGPDQRRRPRPDRARRQHQPG